MAEQASHNVVNIPESASGSSPLVDVAANHTSTPAAESGQNLTSTTTPNQATDTSTPQTNHVADTTVLGAKEVDAGHAAAEPSAGDAAAKADSIPAIAKPVDADMKSNVDQGLPTMNGIHESAIQGSAIEDGGSQDASAANSDTEMSKGDSHELKDGHLHVRTNSVKKPATFSKVSVTKNFLAKSASAAPATVKTGEKASPVNPVAPPAAKPRLIAKTGASIRELQKARQNAESPSGPDASKVWNKNRPAAPQPAKQFTDEELKQQYGIHLATRLQSDENGKESKWADIDEDEDDWVPDAVTWIDGTKSALTPADNATPAPKEEKTEAEQAKPTEGAKPNLAALKKPESSGPPKTILKPGLAAQAKQNGSASQSPGLEKATLKAKSPAPPVKSPWATLPPVDKSSPINLPVQQPPPQPAHFATQDARAYDSSMAPPSSATMQPARQIAADTFDRSWAKGEGRKGELYNSNSNSYEPAPEGRRSSRQDSYHRKPSVLLRPTQSGMDHPEPSPAFQTRSGSQTDGPPSWGARRGSNVSQGSMAARRMSINRGNESYAQHERRPSAAFGHEVNAQKADAPHGMFIHQNAWQQQMPPPPTAGAGEELEDPVKVQERIMKEKRELARKRRLEEEDKAEADRKERLKAKMAALEGAGQSRQERERQAAKDAAAAAAPKPTVGEAPQTTEPSKAVEVKEDKLSQPKEPEAAVATDPLPEPQAQQPFDTSAQGLEQTRVPPPDKIELPQAAPKTEGTNIPVRSISEHMQRQVPRGPLSPKANPRASFQQQQTTASPYRAPNSAFSSPGELKQQPFGRSPMGGGNDGFSSPWPSAGSGNVWGTGSIGNGVFDSGSAFAPMPISMMSQQSSALPPPPGMGRPGTSTRISPQAIGSESRSPSLQPNNNTEQSRAFAPPGMEGRPDHFMSQPRPNGASPNSGMALQQRVPGPIAPPSRAQPSLHNQPAEDSRMNAWKSVAQNMPTQYANAAKAAGPSARKEDSAPTPALPATEIFHETFKKTTRGRLGGREFAKPEYTIHDAQGSRSVSNLPPAVAPAPPSTQTQPAVPVPTASPLNNHWKPTAENTVRLPNGSMNPAHGGTPIQQPPIGPPHTRPQPAPVGTPRRVKVVADPLPPTVNSKSPPPPETTTHPVYSGNATHPHVRLPPSRPVVKLPPQTPAVASQAQSVSMPRQHWGPSTGMRPLVQNEAWQARFNGLFNRTNISTETPPSPPKTPPKMQGPALSVASSSKTAIHDPSVTAGATVSLPQTQQPARRKTAEGFLFDDSSAITSKDTIEQMFNEELSFGSKPLTRIPRNVTYHDVGLNNKGNMLAMRNEDLPKPVQVQSKAQFDTTQVHHRNVKGCYVKMPGVKTKHNPIFWKRSGQYNNKGTFKPKAKAPIPKQSGTNSPVSTAPNGGSGAGSRKASAQKVPTASNVSTPAQKSPAPTTPTDNTAPAGSGKRGGFKASRGRGGAQNVPVKSA